VSAREPASEIVPVTTPPSCGCISRALVQRVPTLMDADAATHGPKLQRPEHPARRELVRASPPAHASPPPRAAPPTARATTLGALIARSLSHRSHGSAHFLTSPRIDTSCVPLPVGIVGEQIHSETLPDLSGVPRFGENSSRLLPLERNQLPT